MRYKKLPPEAWLHVNPTWAQRFFWLWLVPPGRFVMRYRAYGHSPRVPTTGGFLLAPGPHAAMLDPFMVGLGQKRRRLRFMVKENALGWPFMGWLIRWCGGFPVRRGGPQVEQWLDLSRQIVESGDGLTIFMEGRLVVETVGLGTPRNGMARLALQTGAPVVPVGLHGAKRPGAYGKRWWWHWPRITLVWGEALSFERESDPSDERVAEVRDAIWASVEQCFRQATQIGMRPSHRPPSGTSLEAALAEPSPFAR
ncbi:MAG: 1-acyl-sn-glycerol-3-phosphate acyltransferase [Thermoleophilia bacterium]|nr:1-acyl-sn-glycerol-3-phosphate acyltransferase [Thermoleophilia bacterium]